MGMPEIEKYDILVIGSGEAGKYLAWTMAKAGHRTVVLWGRPIAISFHIVTDFFIITLP